MTQVLLYWNHICILQNKEKAFLEELTQCLLTEGIQLTVRYFGLGHPEHMSEYLARPDAVLPDIIVSADLEVYEDSRIYKKLAPDLYPASSWLELRPGPALEAVRRVPELLPFTAIPLVYYTSDGSGDFQKPLWETEGLAFGGINNSAVKTLVKAIWSKYGKEASDKLLKNGHVSDMPIGAFYQVRQGQRQTALVPSLYALRADGEKHFLRVPKEGPLLIPSFFCARRSIPEKTARRLAQAILCPELCRFYAESGDLILYPACNTLPSRQEGSTYLVPEPSWFENVSPEAFYAFYTKALPTARDPFA